MWWPAVATLAAAGAAAAYSSTTWRWKLVGPSEDATPFDPLPTAPAAVAAGAVLAAVPAGLAAGGLIDGRWAWASAAAVAVALAKPLVDIGRISAEIYAAELDVSRGSGAVSGHGDAHSAASPVEGRLLRAASVATAPLNGHLVELAEKVRLAERAAARQRALEGIASENVDRLNRMLSAVNLRPNRRFSDPANMPTRWPGWLKAAWAPAARRIDAIRAIHTHQIEWIALYALLWLRPILLLAVAVLPAWATSGLRPPVDTGTAGDLAWAAALLVATASALAAPRIVPIIQDKSVSEIPLCRRLLWIEAPTWIFLIMAAPSWLAWTYGAMTFTYAERPGWSTRNAVVIGVGGVGGLVTSLALRDADAGQAAIETLVAVVTLAIISTSYGLLLPLVLDRLLFSDLRARRAEHRLEQAIAGGAVAETRQAAIDAARLIEQHDMSGPEADAVRAVAAATDRPTSQRRWWPRIGTLAEIVADAAAPLVPSAGPDARLTVQWEPGPHLAGRAVRRPNRRALERVLKAMIGEADRHALGTIVVTIAEDDGLLHLRVVNQPDPESPPGSGEGTGIVSSELGSLPDGRHAHPPGLQQVRRRGVLRDFWVVEVVCSSQILT